MRAMESTGALGGDQGLVARTEQSTGELGRDQGRLKRKAKQKRVLFGKQRSSQDSVEKTKMVVTDKHLRAHERKKERACLSLLE